MFKFSLSAVFLSLFFLCSCQRTISEPEPNPRLPASLQHINEVSKPIGTHGTRIGAPKAADVSVDAGAYPEIAIKVHPSSDEHFRMWHGDTCVESAMSYWVEARTRTDEIVLIGPNTNALIRNSHGSRCVSRSYPMRRVARLDSRFWATDSCTPRELALSSARLHDLDIVELRVLVSSYASHPDHVQQNRYDYCDCVVGVSEWVRVGTP